VFPTETSVRKHLWQSAQMISADLKLIFAFISKALYVRVDTFGGGKML
jgi:hypothetical protein